MGTYTSGPSVGKPAPIIATQRVFYNGGGQGPPQLDEVWSQSILPRPPAIKTGGILFGTLPDWPAPQYADPGTLSYLNQLRGSSTRPFTLRTYTHWRDYLALKTPTDPNGEAYFQGQVARMSNWARNGFYNTLSIRFVPPTSYYSPNDRTNGCPAYSVTYLSPNNNTATLVRDFESYVRETVRRIATDPYLNSGQVWRVIIGNEGNLVAGCPSEDSDGFFETPDGVVQQAIVRGTIAAREEISAAKSRLQVGINFDAFQGSAPFFLRSLANRGGPPFMAAVNFAGMQVYPRTFNAGLTFDNDYLVRSRQDLTDAGFPTGVRMAVTEIGNPLVSAPQSIADDQQGGNTGLFIDLTCNNRYRLNIDEFDWFGLYDIDSSSPDNGFAHNGLVRWFVGANNTVTSSLKPSFNAMSARVVTNCLP